MEPAMVRGGEKHEDCWQIEAAIPMRQLTADRPGVGSAWAINVVRILPGRGVQGWSLPAGVEPRPEGMGLLMFQRPTPERNGDERPRQYPQIETHRPMVVVIPVELGPLREPDVAAAVDLPIAGDPGPNADVGR